MKRAFLAAAIVSLSIWSGASAADLWVDNVRGDDANGDASPAKPLATPQAALQRLKSGDTLHLVNTGRPYQTAIRIEGKVMAGTEDKPTVLDGHGATVGGLFRYRASAWKDLGDGVFSMPLPNNAHVMDKHWWGFDLVFFDGKAGTNCETREQLQPGSYFLYKFRPSKPGEKYPPDHNTLYVQLPPGKTPDDVRIETVGPGNVYVGTSNVTVRNVVGCWSGGDAFDTAGGARGVIFDHVEGHHCMDQGISHHGTQVLVRDSWFHDNAGCGIVDVFMGRDAETTYIRCLIENDTYRGGVEFYNGTYEMTDCIIRNNVSKALAASRGAHVKLTNCVLIGRDANQTAPAITVDVNASLRADRCTIWRFPIAVQATMWKDDANAPVVELNDCALLASKNALLWNVINSDKRPVLKIGRVLVPEGVQMELGRYYPGKGDWKTVDQPLGDWSKAVVKPLELTAPPYSPPGGTDIGAKLDANHLFISPR